MSKGLRSLAPEERQKAINRRIGAVIDKKGKPVGTTGLGFWAAIDARKKERSY